MPQNRQNRISRESMPVVYITIIFLIVFLFFFILIVWPQIYNFMFGKQIVEKHIQEVVGNKTNDAEIASALMQWVHDNVHYPTVGEKILLFAGSDGWYRVNNKTRLFLNSGPASWTIKSKLGRCGEDARYFVGVMTQLGYKARIVRPAGWDHAWAEYYNKEGIKVVLDPSGNKVITDLHVWVQNKSFTKIEAVDLKGNKEDVTAEYT